MVYGFNFALIKDGKRKAVKHIKNDTILIFIEEFLDKFTKSIAYCEKEIVIKKFIVNKSKIWWT